LNVNRGLRLGGPNFSFQDLKCPPAHFYLPDDHGDVVFCDGVVVGIICGSAEDIASRVVTMDEDDCALCSQIYFC